MSRSIPQINSDKPLGGRYKVISQLGVGGFGRTFLAEDLHLPGHPQCVVKQLKPQFKSDDTLQMARRCFNTEAEVLYQLGNHDQIPRLLAHFEDNQEFYLAQEFVEGSPLTQELGEGKPWSEAKVFNFLQDILQVLVFVHEQQVIHRDLKPSNLIRRRSDSKIVLIDFGAVKQVSTQNYDLETGLTNLTISIGTQGYMPNEQLAGKPRFSSDLYAIGMIGIQALTGIHPRRLGEDDRGEIAWHHRALHASPALLEVIDRMVRYDFRDRYATVTETLEALSQIPVVSQEQPPVFQPIAPYIELESDRNTAGHSGSNTTTPPALPPDLDFSSADLTVGSEEGLSTAIWVHSEVPQTDETHPTNSTHQTRGTGVTQAVGRPYSPPEAETTGTAAEPSRLKSWFKQPSIALSLLAGLATVGLVTLVVQQAAPQFFVSIFNPQPPSSSPVPAATPAASPSPTIPPLDSTNVSSLFQYANQLMQQKSYARALEYYDRIIALNPSYAEAYAGRCETLNQLNRSEEAVVSCNDALAYKPDYTEALWSKGNALLLQGRTYEALKIYEDVTYYNPDFAPGWVKRGEALQELGRSAEAVYVLDQAISLQRNLPEAWSTKGEALLNLQRYDEAIVSLDKALQLQDPDDPATLELRQQARARLRS